MAAVDDIEKLKKKLKYERNRLLEAKNLNDALVSSIGDGIIVVDEYGIITQINRRSLEMLGYQRKELLGRWFPHALPSKDKEGNDIPAAERPAVKSILSGRPSSEITSYVRKDGSVFPVAGTAAPFVVNNKPLGTIIVFRDFSQEFAVQKAKDEFVSLASHQLRTPLTSIKLYVELLKNDLDSLSDEFRNHLIKVEAATISMLELVDNFLNISKLELGRLELRLEKVDLSQVIKEQIGRLQDVASQNDITIDFRVSPDYMIKTDRMLFSEVIYNLLTNSIRYRQTESPKIKVSLKDNESSVIVSVKDNGIGIPKAVQSRVFERLYRADNAKDSQSEGTGLGLYLVEKVVSALGGRISLKSQEGVGTTFFIEIPKRT